MTSECPLFGYGCREKCLLAKMLNSQAEKGAIASGGWTQEYWDAFVQRSESFLTKCGRPEEYRELTKETKPEIRP